jgi:hypothetical protein
LYFTFFIQFFSISLFLFLFSYYESVKIKKTLLNLFEANLKTKFRFYFTQTFRLLFEFYLKTSFLEKFFFIFFKNSQNLLKYLILKYYFLLHYSLTNISFLLDYWIIIFIVFYLFFYLLTFLLDIHIQIFFVF